MKRIYSVMIFFFFVAVTSLYSQIKINDAGSVSVGSNDADSQTKLYITEDGLPTTSTNYLLKLEYLGESSIHQYGVYSKIVRG